MILPGAMRLLGLSIALAAILASPIGAQVVLRTLTSPSPPGVSFGRSVATAGDVDGDGFDDLLVGEPEATVGAVAYTGRVYVFSGASGGVLHSVAGSVFAEALGQVVRSAGDVDGDGVPDFGAVAFGPGEVKVFSGANAVPLLSVGAPTARDFDGVGDLDGDGFGDVLVGSPWASGSMGGATVHSGANGATLFSFQGWGTRQLFGWSVSTAGDLNGDGTPDLLIGAPTNFPYSSGGPSFVSAYSGADGSLLLTVSPPFGWGPARFGSSVAGGSDVDGDGVPDFVVGAPLYCYSGVFCLGVDLGAANLYSGATGSLYASVLGTTSGAMVGTQVAMPGDVDGDGGGDVLVTRWAGSVYFGDVYFGTTGAILLTVSVPVPWSARIAPAGDVNGDGFPDFISGLAPQNLPGTATVYSGAAPGVVVFGSGCAGSAGEVPRIGASGSPAVGSVLPLHVSRALGGTPATLLLGVSDTMWGSTPLPLNLSVLGMPACELLVSADFVFPTVTAGTGSSSGHSTLPLGIPPTPSLSGAIVFAQWYVVDPGPALLPGALTRAVRLTIQ